MADAIALSETVSVGDIYSSSHAVQYRSSPLATAEAQYRSVLEREPRHFDALHMFGLLRHQQGRHAEALDLIRAALDVDPGSLAALSNCGMVLHALGRHDEAVASYTKVLASVPENPDVLMNLGAALAALGRHDEALASLDKVLTRNPHDAEALYNRALALARLGRIADAAAAYDQVLALNPRDAEALNSRGVALRALRRHTAAIASFDAALALRPNYAEAHYNKANALADSDRSEEAITHYNSAIAAKPQYIDAVVSRASVLAGQKRHRDAIAGFQQALAIAPEHPYAIAGLASSALAICDWALTQKCAAELPAKISNGTSDVDPLRLLEYFDDPALHLAGARNHFRVQMPTRPRPLWDGTPFRHDRIRLGYLSADFRPHAVASLIAGLFECHDRSKFEVHAFSYGPEDNSAVRGRIVRSVDQFRQVDTKSDQEIANVLHELEIDIAVDLTGYTRGERLGVLAHHPCPVQVSYLGFPGTLGVDFMDYVIADPVVLPFDQQPYYSEQIVQLPECYQVNDGRRTIAVETPTRAQAGLPASGFVFCCFNNPYKISSALFDIWMRLLKQVNGSVLWLIEDINAQENLRREAATRGVDPERVVFAPRTGLPQHLARHRLADLFVDTLPYNAHTTASDALWAGLPVLTCRGRTFSGRVAASLNHAVGLEDLVTSSLAAYEAMARQLASDTSLLKGYRDTLAKNRLTCSLFDTARFAHHIEAAYFQMWQRSQRGEAPLAFAVGTGSAAVRLA